MKKGYHMVALGGFNVHKKIICNTSFPHNHRKKNHHYNTYCNNILYPSREACYRLVLFPIAECILQHLLRQLREQSNVT